MSDLSADSAGESESESSDNDVVLNDYGRWSDNLRETTLPAFIGSNPGPVNILEGEKREIDFLNLVFPEELYVKISEETNRYAELCISKKKQIFGWYHTTPEEVRDLMGCFIVMGGVSAPAQDLYWSKDKLFHLSCLEEIFTRNPFEVFSDTLMWLIQQTTHPVTKMDMTNLPTSGQ